MAIYPGNGNKEGGFPPPAFTQPPPLPPQAVCSGASQQQQAQQQLQQFHNSSICTSNSSHVKSFLVHPWSGGRSPPLPIASVTHSSPLQSSMVSSSNKAQRVVQQGTVHSVRDNMYHQQQGGTGGAPTY